MPDQPTPETDEESYLAVACPEHRTKTTLNEQQWVVRKFVAQTLKRQRDDALTKLADTLNQHPGENPNYVSVLNVYLEGLQTGLAEVTRERDSLKGELTAIRFPDKSESNE